MAKVFYPLPVDVSARLDHDDPRVFVRDYLIKPEWTERYDLLRVQFDGCVQFYNWAVEYVCDQVARFASEGKGYRATSYFDMCALSSEFKKSAVSGSYPLPVFDQHRYLSSAILYPVARYAYQRLRAVRAWDDPIRYLRIDRFDELYLTHYEDLDPDKADPATGDPPESGAILFRSAKLKSFESAGGYPEWVAPVYVSMIGIVCIDSRADLPDEGSQQPKSRYLVQRADQFYLRIVYGPPEQQVCAFPKKEKTMADQPAAKPHG